MNERKEIETKMETNKNINHVLYFILPVLIMLFLYGCNTNKTTENKAFTAGIPYTIGDQTFTPEQQPDLTQQVGTTGGYPMYTSSTTTSSDYPGAGDIPPVTMQTFEDTLSNYGQWIQVNKDDVDPDYINQDNTADENANTDGDQNYVSTDGNDNSDMDADINVSVIWVPYSNYEVEDWNPYVNGRWVWSPYGWEWVSDYHWGYGPYHYGRWWHSRDYGWCWSPGYRWGPSWVNWCENDGYIGWHPISPREHHHENGNWNEGNTGNTSQHPISIDPRWVFVKRQDFTREVNSSTIESIDLRTGVMNNNTSVFLPGQQGNTSIDPRQNVNVTNVKSDPRVQNPGINNTQTQSNDKTQWSVLPKNITTTKVGGNNTSVNNRNSGIDNTKNVTLSKNDPKNVSVNRKNTNVIDNKNGTLSKSDPKNSNSNKDNNLKVVTTKSVTLPKSDPKNTSGSNKQSVTKNTDVTKGSQNKTTGSNSNSWSIQKQNQNSSSEPKTKNETVTKNSQNNSSWNSSSPTNKSSNTTKGNDNQSYQPKTQNTTVTKSTQNNNSSSEYKSYTPPPVKSNNSSSYNESKPKVNNTPPPQRQETNNSSKNNSSNSNSSPNVKQKGNN